MGATKSKVDSPPDEETETQSQTSDSTLKRVETSRNRHEHRRRRRSEEKRRQNSDRDPASSSQSPDENLLRPFTYRTRKDRLLDSLGNGDGDHGKGLSTDDNQSEENERKLEPSNQKRSVRSILKKPGENLIAKEGSYSSIRKSGYETTTRRRSMSKTPRTPNDSNLLLVENYCGECKRKESLNKLKSRKLTSPTDDEEKIIETLIQPRRKQGSSTRVVDRKDSFDVVDLPANVVDDASRDERKANPSKQTKDPPQPPPVDFPNTSESDGETEVPTNRSSGQKVKQPPVQDNLPEEKPPETSVVRRMLQLGLPSHLKELKLRFTNDLPRTPLEENINSKSKMEKVATKKSDKPAHSGNGPLKKSYFSNDVPLVDSLHILASDNAGSAPKVVVKGGKHSGGKSGKNKTTDVKMQSKNAFIDDLGENTLSNSIRTAGRNSAWNKTQGFEDRDKRKSVIKSPLQQPNDDVIKCFPVKTEYVENLMESKRCGQSKGCERRGGSKTARTQTSSAGLIDSSVQTWPDIEFQNRDCRRDVEIQYDMSKETRDRRNAPKETKDRPSRQKLKIVEDSSDCKDREVKYCNGSTQWRDTDLLVNSSCELVKGIDSNDKKHSKSERRHSGRASKKSKSEARMKGCTCNRGHNDGRFQEQDVCCMHVQVMPEVIVRDSSANDIPERNVDAFIKKKDRMSRTHRSSRESGVSLCQRCSRTQLLSSDKLSTQVNYATSSSRSRNLSLLSPLGSNSTVGTRVESSNSTRGKCENLYRQMEELGLGFLKDGEWITKMIPTKVPNNSRASSDQLYRK